MTDKPSGNVQQDELLNELPTLGSLTLDDFDDISEEPQPEEDYKLSLLQNALDSLDEGLAQYKAFLQCGKVRASKFSVLHFAHYLELLLKHCVAEMDPDAIWVDDSKTIGVYAALRYLVEAGIEVPSSFKADLEWFKALRNDVEHYEFSLNATQLRQTVARLLYDAEVIRRACSVEIEFLGVIDEGNIELFAELSKEYEARLKVSYARVKEAERKAYAGVRPKFMEQVEFHIGECDHCGHETFVTNHDSPTGYQCEFCGEQHSDSMPMDCTLCGMPWTRGDLTYFEDWTGEGHRAYACPRCLHNPAYVKDD